MDFFDKLGKKASEAYKVTADKTGKIAKETKMKFKMSDLKDQISEVYEEIGKQVYEKYVREEEYSIQKELEEECTKIDMLSDEIDHLLKECRELKDKKQCPSCYVEIEKEFHFCPNCGKEQEAKETEDVNDIKESEVEEKIDDQIAMEEMEMEMEQEETTNLEKTIAIESNVEIEEEEES